jgi:hypothetical protein
MQGEIEVQPMGRFAAIRALLSGFFNAAHVWKDPPCRFVRREFMPGRHGRSGDGDAGSGGLIRAACQKEGR